MIYLLLMLVTTVGRSPIAARPQIYSAKLMQHLGLKLWQWLFCRQVGNAFAQSQGIAIGQGKSLRLRLEIRDPDSTHYPGKSSSYSQGSPHSHSIDRCDLVVLIVMSIRYRRNDSIDRNPLSLGAEYPWESRSRPPAGISDDFSSSAKYSAQRVQSPQSA